MSAETALIMVVAEKVGAPLAVGAIAGLIKLWRDVATLKEKLKENGDATDGELASMLQELAKQSGDTSALKLALVEITGRVNAVEERHAEIIRRFDRLEDKLDRVLPVGKAR